MKLHGEDYSKRLESFSHFTMVLISGISTKEMWYKSNDIVSESELNEEEVIEQLLELIHSDLEAFPKVSHDEALKIVCEAMEDGHIFQLFEILSDTAELVMVDEYNSIFGSRNIINFLVDERLNHIYPADKETIICEIVGPTKGKPYGIKGKCILLTYYLENGMKEQHIIKVHFESNQICKLEVF